MAGAARGGGGRAFPLRSAQASHFLTYVALSKYKSYIRAMNGDLSILAGGMSEKNEAGPARRVGRSGPATVLPALMPGYRVPAWPAPAYSGRAGIGSTLARTTKVLAMWSPVRCR